MQVNGAVNFRLPWHHVTNPPDAVNKAGLRLQFLTSHGAHRAYARTIAME